jgi:hypothetical protein
MTIRVDRKHRSRMHFREGDETRLVQELLIKVQDFNDSQLSRHGRLASDPLRHLYKLLYTPGLCPTPLYLGTPAFKHGDLCRDAALGPNLGHLLGLAEWVIGARRLRIDGLDERT